MKYLLCTIMNYSLIFATAQVGAGGAEKKDITETHETKGRKTLYGTASYYADKFNGRGWKSCHTGTPFCLWTGSWNWKAASVS